LGSFLFKAYHSRAEPAPVQMGAGIQKCSAEKLDARLRGHDGKNSPIARLIDDYT